MQSWCAKLLAVTLPEHCGRRRACTPLHGRGRLALQVRGAVAVQVRIKVGGHHLKPVGLLLAHDRSHKALDERSPTLRQAGPGGLQCEE